MPKTATAKRYAMALFDLAGARGKEEAWLEELNYAADILGDPTVGRFFKEPRVPADTKQEAIGQMLPSADQLVVNLIGLLVERQAGGVLPAIVRAYNALLNSHLNRVQARVTSAVPVSPEQSGHLNHALAKILEQEVLLDFTEDPSIIGGVVVQVGDRIIDGSVRTRLEALRRRLEQGSLS